MENKTIIEINGIKMEVDLRQAKVIENYKIGDNVRLLVKEYDGYKVFPAVIVSFDAFTKLPTIVVAYLEMGYQTADLKFAYINSESAKTEGGKYELAPLITLMRHDLKRPMSSNL